MTFRFRLQPNVSVLMSLDATGVCTACGGSGIIENEGGITACPKGVTRPCKPARPLSNPEGPTDG